MSKLYKPGEDNKPAGSYKEVGPRGGDVNHGNNAKIDKGDRLPPTSKAGNKWTKK
ncbi:YjzC family protein [Tetragenococcus halophilus]|uniref:YjzC family protein n=1 Tax=Tetragenococcus muriaticus TaxID=64642 RepID=UPI0009DF7FEB|nr:YjzC family protein [Tetragenococcus muriaticus]QXN86305.1 YjzC family protein [Tetragenococcus halophilus]